MSEEEKKAIEWFKLSIKVNYEELKELQKGEFTGYGTMEDLKKGEICNKKIILNLIEKQQKLLEQKDNKINKAIEKLKEHKHDLDYEPWNTYKLNGNILFDLVKILEE